MMRKVLLAVLAAAILVFATAANGAGGPYSFAVGAGSGVQVFGPDSSPFQFAIAAYDGPNGPRGQFVVHDPDVGTFTADVQCLQVVGNRAVAAGPLRRPVVEGGTTFSYAALTVEDNGGPGGLPDRAAPVLLFPASFDRVCAATAPLTFLTFPLEHGDVVVHDAS